jgi:hypothetical protein
MTMLKHKDSARTRWQWAARVMGGALLGRWLRRAVGRECTVGLWTMSPDGKLNCECWCVNGGQPD